MLKTDYVVHMIWITDAPTGEMFNLWYCSNPEGKVTPYCGTEKGAKKCADKGDWLEYEEYDVC